MFSSSTVSLESLEHETHHLLYSSLASGSWVAYRRSVDKFIDFRSQVQLPQIWPVPDAHVIMFISFLPIGNFAPSTINSHISALAFVHNVNWWPNPTDNFLIKKMKEALRRNNSRMDGSLPITSALLQRLISCLPLICKSSYEVLLFRAAFLLAFFGFLRIGEFARTAYTQNQDFKLIADSDLRVSGSTLWLKIRYSKTDQQGVTSSLQIEGSSNPHLCPVLAISQYLSSRPLFHGPFFLFTLEGKFLSRVSFHTF